MNFQDTIIAFVDILGWKALVENTEASNGMALSDLLKLLDCFGTGQEREGFEKSGPTCCPRARFQDRNRDFRLTQVSDCAIVSAEVSPAGVINLLWYCWRTVFQLLEHGIMCRGYVKLGRIYHTERHVTGSGYQGALAGEKRSTPSSVRRMNGGLPL